jgi:DNA-binding GntR family transcriptional regulator
MQSASEPALGHAQGESTRGRLENLTLWQRVYDHLREEILSGELPAGSELQEVALSSQLGVSRGPIREAIGRLAAEGLVVVRPRRGAVVRALSKQEFLEAYQVREALEMMAVRLAVPRLEAPDFEKLENLIGAMETYAGKGEVAGFFEANALFHAALFEVAGNCKLQELYRQLLGQMGRYRTRSAALRGSLQRSVAEHRAIVRAARRGNVERAVHLMSEHIRVPQRRLQSLSEDELVSMELAS